MFKRCQRAVSTALVCILLCMSAAGCTGKNVSPSSEQAADSQTGLQTNPQSDLQVGNKAEKGVKVAVQEIQPSTGQSAAEGETDMENASEADAKSGAEAAGLGKTSAAEAAGLGETSAAETQPPAANETTEEQWQGKVTFPDWKGYTDDTLAMNHMYSFFGYHGQGSLRICPAAKVTGFNLYVNDVLVDTSELTGGRQYDLDISSLTIDGMNTIQISEIDPYDLAEAVTVCVPYPEILPGSAQDEGMSAQALEMISDLISTDISHGFTSAQLAVIKNGRLVYENAWGKTNSYLPDGKVNESSPQVTTDTLYDLASLTKMFSVNYALQKLVTDDQISLDARIVDYLGKGFAEDTIIVPNEKGETPEADLDQIKEWKTEVTIRDLLRHQGGFPADPKYSAPYLYKDELEEGEDYPENLLFAGNTPGEKTRKATIDMICKTPLWYEPGTKTVYSDADYMILGLVVEQVTGEDLNSWLRKTFWEPMGLTHITYNPLKNGFTKEDCAATELNGNTRDNLLEFPGYRTYTLQGEVHDEKAFYSMDGISGHAGLFGNASDVAKLASVMFCGGYGSHRFFSQNVIDLFTAPKMENAANWALGWWRQGDGQRIWYFGSQAGSDTIGHQGWTGTLVMADPQRNLVVAYLTNKINSRVTNVKKNANSFDGGWYTASTLGFVPQILSIGMDSDADISGQLLDLSAEMALDSLKLIPEDLDAKARQAGRHPAIRNAQSKFELFEHMAGRYEDQTRTAALRDRLRTAFEKAHIVLP